MVFVESQGLPEVSQPLTHAAAEVNTAAAAAAVLFTNRYSMVSLYNTLP